MTSWVSVNNNDDVFETKDPPPSTGLKSRERKNLWEDDDDGVKESWDDDDDVADVKPGKTAAASTTASKKAPETKGKNQANAKAAKPAAAEAATPSEISTTSTSHAGADKSQKQSDNDEPIERFIPKSQKEFAEYADRIARDLLRPYEKSYHYIGLMKAMNKVAVASLTSANVKEIVSSMTTVANEKLKAEKVADAGKKKPGQKKKRLHVNKAEGQRFRNVGDED